jgi:hypothetical protein
MSRGATLASPDASDDDMVNQPSDRAHPDQRPDQKLTRRPHYDTITFRIDMTFLQSCSTSRIVDALNFFAMAGVYLFMSFYLQNVRR